MAAMEERMGCGRAQKSAGDDAVFIVLTVAMVPHWEYTYVKTH